MASNLRKFVLLLWKNSLYRVRHPFRLAIEIISPFIFLLTLVLLRYFLKVEVGPEKYYQPFCVFPSQNRCTENEILKTFKYVPKHESKLTPLKMPCPRPPKRSKYLVYTPRNRNLDRVMDKLRPYFKDIIGFEKPGLLTRHFIMDKQGINTLAGLQFNRNLTGRQPLPAQMKVILRFPAETYLGPNTNKTGVWNTDKVFYPHSESSPPRYIHSKSSGDPDYYKEGFLTLQQALVYSIIGVVKRKPLNDLPFIELNRFPYASWTSDAFMTASTTYIPLILSYTFFVPFIVVIYDITTEEEKKIKFLMSLNGVSEWLYWVAWFLHAYIFFLYEIVLIVIFIKYKWFYGVAIFSEVSTSIYFVILNLYVINTILSCFVISIICPNHILGSIVGSLLFIVEPYPAISIITDYKRITKYLKMLTCLIPKSAFHLITYLLCVKESKRFETTWFNLFEIEEEDNISIGNVVLMLIGDIFTSAILGLYARTVLGSHRPWYLINFKKKLNQHVTHEPSIVSITSFFEGKNPRRPCIIEMQEVTKVFENTTSIASLTLNVHEDEIVVLLGHSGAGKSTTINMLAGLISPTSGSIKIEGLNLRDYKKAHKHIGICCQEDILFSELNIREHLYFFLVLKGVEKDKVQDEIRKYVHNLELEEHESATTKYLSSNTKRKLCAAIALCGNSKVVLLDEPTAGMDPLVMRSFWGFLMSEKKERAILLATHHILEADAVADRVAIISEGQLICFGTNQFLKHILGAEYNFLIKTHDNCVPEDVTAFLKHHIPLMKFVAHNENELVYSVMQIQSKNFHRMLEDLESHMEDLALVDYRINVITLEEVYMTVDFQSKAQSLENRNIKQVKFDHTILDFGGSRLSVGCRLILSQYLASFSKLLYIKRRHWLVAIIQFLLPVVFVFVSTGIGHEYSDAEMPQRRLTLKDYPHSIELISGEKNVFYHKYQETPLIDGKGVYVHNMTETMINLTEMNVPTIDYTYIVGAEFKNDNYLIAWFNGDLYHAPPLSLSLILNGVYKKFLGEHVSVQFVNFPLHFKADTKIEQYQANERNQPLFTSLALGIHVSLAMLIIYYSKERYRGFKRLQLTTGLRVYVYWTAAFILEVIFFYFTIFAIAMVLISRSFKTDHIGLIVAVTNLFGNTSLAFVFLMSLFFKYPMTAFSFTVIIGLLMELIVSTVSILLRRYLKEKEVLNWLHYCHSYMLYGDTLKKINVERIIQKLCTNYIDKCLEQNFTNSQCVDKTCSIATQCCNRNEMDVITNILVAFAYFIVVFLVVFLIDYKVFTTIKMWFVKGFVKTYDDIYDHNQDEKDKDVVREGLKIRGTDMNELFKKYEIVIDHVSKYHKRYYIVKDLSLAIEEGECFGIVGIEGAGKTITFKMIIGTETPTSGNIWIRGVSSTHRLFRVKTVIGYCPQIGGLMNTLTLMQTLRIFCLIRGIPLRKCTSTIETLSESLGLTKYLKMSVGNVSAGVKKLLSVAIAVVGEPPIICLDEPTSGMDINAKRKVWNVLNKIRLKGAVIIFSTNNMEECEAISTRMAIMVNGKFKCLGSKEYLREKFAKGQFVIVKTTPNALQARLAEIDRFMQKNFERCRLLEVHYNTRTYEILEHAMPWSKMFKVMEEAKETLPVDSYSLGDRTLEHVFLSFSRFQY